VCSGYSNDPTLADYRDLGFRGIISKPFKPAELAHAVYEVVSQRLPEEALI
jgi:DNA-binding NarL/FixJ family response regulator